MIYKFLIINFLCFSLTLLSQTGPGGVGNSGSNVLWLSVDNGVYTNAGTVLAATTENVQQWNDRSGNTRHATQSLAASRPNYFTNVVNGLPVLRFSAGNDYILSAGVSTANVASVWAIAAYASLPSSNPGIVLGAPAGTGSNVAPGNKTIGMWVSNAGANPVWGRGIQSNGTSRDISQTTGLSNNTFYIINTIYRAATSINQFVNGAAAGNNNSHNGTLSSWEDITIGRQANESWNGDIAEVIFYNTEVNEAQRIIIDNYLSAKYGLGLTANDLYNKDTPANGNFDFEVAGIGRADASNIHNSAQGSGIVRILNPSGLGNDEFLFWGHNNASLQANNTADVPPGVQGRMDRVWRVSEVNSSGTAVNVGSIDMQFDLSTLGSVTASDLRLLVDADNDGVFTDETPIAGATLVSGAVYQFSGVTAITNNVRFTLATINKNQTPLPVELLYIKVRQVNESQVEILWSTATEKNNTHFEIQRSLDGRNWEAIGELPGAVNSYSKKNYLFTDKYPYASLSYYRIEQFDLDGGSSISPPQTIDLTDKIKNTLLVYPNPSSGELTIQGEVSEIESLKIFDAIGREMDVINNRTTLHARKIILDISNWLQGIYFLKTEQETLKIIKQ